MRTLTYTPQEIQKCNCPNQQLLEVGETCELCMGLVSRHNLFSRKSEANGSDLFDEFYFEELESYFEDIEFAA